MQKHERQQSERLGVGQKINEHAAKPNRFLGEMRQSQRIAGRSRISLIEDQIDDRQHGIEAVGKLSEGRNLIGNACLANFRFAADDALRDRNRVGQKRAGDSLGGQPAYFAQGQGHLRAGGNGRMAAREDQPQPIVFQFFIASRIGLGQFIAALGQLRETGIERARRRMASTALKRPVETSQARIGRHAVTRPLLDRGGKRLVQGLFGAVKITDQANERGEDTARLRPIDTIDDVLNLRGGHFSHRSCPRCIKPKEDRQRSYARQDSNL